MSKHIIAIQGRKNAGKDEIAKILRYTQTVPKILHKYYIYVMFNFIIKYFSKYKIIKYADKMKKMLSVLLSVDVKLFENRNFKENNYVDFNTLTLYDKNNVDQKKILSDVKFAKELKNNNNITEKYCLSIRQLLQYFGTEVMRKHFGDKLWINATMNSNNNFIIISDQRFKIENEIAMSLNSYIIHVIRPCTIKGTHSSETQLDDLFLNREYNKLIDNNETLKELFNKCKNIKICQ